MKRTNAVMIICLFLLPLLGGHSTPSHKKSQSAQIIRGYVKK